MRIGFLPLDERGSADTAYSVVDYNRPAGDRVLGTVARYNREWVATDRNGSWVTTRVTRRLAAHTLAVQL